MAIAPIKPLLDGLKPGPITEEDLRHILVGKSLYLRGGFLDNSLQFGENGQLIGHSPLGSYTLSGIEIEKVHLSKHKLELEGARYGTHFLAGVPYGDPSKTFDRVKITPKKKFVKITVDRELVVTPKKKKGKDQDKDAKGKTGPGGVMAPALPKAGDAAPAEAASAETAQAENKPADTEQAENQPAAGDAKPAAADAPTTVADGQTAAADAKPSATAAGQNEPTNEPTEEERAKAEMAAAPIEERPADPNSVTTTTSPAHAGKVLTDALDKIFATGLDERMMAAMPDFWKVYYDSVAGRTDYKPKDQSVLRQSDVDQKAKLLSKFIPESNDFAQDAGVAGMSLYHTVIGPDGKAEEVAVARPIGFGLDENAVAAIRKASFQPAMKDGKPVPVVLDLVVQFRIYSKRTNVASKPDQLHDPALPGPYTLQEQERQAQAQAAAPPAQSQTQSQNQ